MKRSPHNLSRTIIGTGNMGELIPVGWYEVLPGDTVQHSCSVLLRASPLLSPPMHPVVVRLHTFVVPLRILWNEGATNIFENFITGGPDGLNAATPPTITVNSGSGWAVGSLADYLEVPTGVDDLPVSALPFRAYAKIWNECYRDEDLQTALTIDYTDGADTTTNTTLQNICWEKDYLTSSRLTPQKGTAVTLPIGTSAPVKTSASQTVTGAHEAAQWLQSDGNVLSVNKAIQTKTSQTLDTSNTATTSAGGFAIYPSNLYADLAAATGATIDQLREALAMQKYMENRSRFGSRFVEYLLSLGVKSSDARLQRPEYVFGAKGTVQFSEVLQQGVTTSGTPSTGVGSLLGHGLGALRTRPARRFYEEHGIVMTLLSVRPKTIYVNGLNRKFSRGTKEDYWQREFEHIGQQEVLNKEAYWAHAAPNGIFGYQDRYDEYRRNESYVSGDFRTTLNYWHYGRIFSSDPTLNAAFVSSTPTTRVYQSTSADNMYFMVHHNIQARRLVSRIGTPAGLY